MKRQTLLALATVGSLTFASSAARAQSLPPPAPPAPGEAAAPAAAPAVAPPAQAEQAAPTAGMVRMHFRMYRGKKSARIYVQRPDGAIGLVCATPCTADVPAGAQMRVTVGDAEEPHLFAAPGDMGPEVDIEVRPASAGPLIGGIVMLGSGGALMLSGALFVALSDSSSILTRNVDYKTVGYVCIGLGAGVALGGLIWLLSRSTEPRVQGDPHRGNAVYTYGRSETLFMDTASAKPREPTSLVAPPIVAPVLDFTF